MGSRKIHNLSLLVGENIARRRKQLGMTQDDLAERLKISGSAMSRIESGQASPRFSRLEELAEILECQVADLFRTANKPLSVRLDTIEDMLRPLPANTQEDLVHLLVVAIQMVKSTQSVNGTNHD